MKRGWGIKGRNRTRPWQRHVQGHRCRRILQCVTRLEFAVRVFGVSVRFFFFFNFYFILHWLLAFFLAYFWVLRPKMSIYRKNTCKQTWLCAKPIHYPYAMYGMRIFFDCAHISWRTCSWPCLRKLAKGVGPKCVEEYSN